MSLEKPILVSIIAPAGFGKSELLAAWQYYLMTQRLEWATLATTGVSSTTLGGATLHWFLGVDRYGESTTCNRQAEREHLTRVQGLIIDEAMMAAVDIMFKCFEVLERHPLRPCLRRANALPLLGFRDLILCGDIRQLPPASGQQPFWGTATFQKMFEIFRLREDRRHERDLPMQSIKELLAWGGTRPHDDIDVDKEWPVHDDLFDFFVNGYLRGWGMTGKTVDLDIGTALFPRRADVKRWNQTCIAKIEASYANVCEAVDIHGFDPRSRSDKPHPDRRDLAGLQFLELLPLRTSPEHRMRLILLQNLDVANGWANGTRLRLLASQSWTGRAQLLRKNAKGVE